MVRYGKAGQGVAGVYRSGWRTGLLALLQYMESSADNADIAHRDSRCLGLLT
jgi:hypothetical protein